MQPLHPGSACTVGLLQCWTQGAKKNTDAVTTLWVCMHCWPLAVLESMVRCPAFAELLQVLYTDAATTFWVCIFDEYFMRPVFAPLHTDAATTLWVCMQCGTQCANYNTDASTTLWVCMHCWPLAVLDSMCKMPRIRGTVACALL